MHQHQTGKSMSNTLKASDQSWGCISHSWGCTCPFYPPPTTFRASVRYVIDMSCTTRSCASFWRTNGTAYVNRYEYDIRCDGYH